MSRLYDNQVRSRAASTSENITEIHDGIITRPSKKFTDMSQPSQQTEAQVIDLQEYASQSKAGSSGVQVNKLREIVQFQKSNGRI